MCNVLFLFHINYDLILNLNYSYNLYGFLKLFVRARSENVTVWAQNIKK